MDKYQFALRADSRCKSINAVYDDFIEYRIQVPTYLDVLKYIFSKGKYGRTYEIVECWPEPINCRCETVKI